MITNETDIELGMSMYVKITWHDQDDLIHYDQLVVGSINKCLDVNTINRKSFDSSCLGNIRQRIDLLWYSSEREECYGIEYNDDFELIYDDTYGTSVYAPSPNDPVKVGYVLEEMSGGGVATWELCTQKEYEVNNIKNNL